MGRLIIHRLLCLLTVCGASGVSSLPLLGTPLSRPGRLAAEKVPFDEVAYEKDRLEKDAQAMEAMKEEAAAEFSKLRTPWKWEIRKRIWDLMEEILEDRAKIVEDLQNGRLAPHDAVKLSKEQFGGFDIYQSVSGQMRDYHNRRP